jgi:GcrA cell cycle regulator
MIQLLGDLLNILGFYPIVECPCQHAPQCIFTKCLVNKPLSEGRSKPMAERVANRKSIALPKLRIADVVPLNIPLIELGYGTCKYPTAESSSRHLFCGLSAIVSSAPYCRDHAAICFQPPDRFRDKKLFGDSLRAAGSITIPSTSAPKTVAVIAIQ